jgi:nicotinate-nucleotide--dimethylbenzimidazole phosphoribosyltransferase
VHHEKVASGSSSFLEGPAMSGQQCQDAQAVGRRAVERLLQGRGAAAGPLVLCVGELGIGNSTSAAALVAALTGAQPAEVCGRGTGERAS